MTERKDVPGELRFEEEALDLFEILFGDEASDLGATALRMNIESALRAAAAKALEWAASYESDLAFTHHEIPDMRRAMRDAAAALRGKP